MTSSPPDSEQPRGGRDGVVVVHERPVILRDLLGQLEWPVVLRAGRAAASPGRVLVGGAVVLVVMLLVTLTEALFPAGVALFAGDRLGWLGTAGRDGGPWRNDSAGSGELWVAGVLVLLVLSVWSVGAGGIARSAAIEHGYARSTPWPRTMAWGLGRWSSLIGVCVVPAFIGLVLIGLVGLAGLLLAVPVLDVIGAVLLVLLVPLVVLGVVLLLSVPLTVPLFVGAIGVEDCDSYDAFQRVWAAWVGRPLRVLAGYAVAVLVAAALFFVGLLVWNTAASVMSWAAQLSEGGRLIVAPGGGLDPEGGVTREIAAGVLGVGGAIAGLLVAAYGVSYTACAGVYVYLYARFAIDGVATDEVAPPLEER